ncbi:MAG: glycosyltransferase family 2 protein [Chloroflexi bacterium]|nr:glycosyltransferase family 2 protein [Chloroflexota bacterium]
MKSVDVVILSLNRQQLISETIENILQQKNVELNIWIVDQGSDPEVIAMLQSLVDEHSNLHLLKLEKNLGVPGGRNVGMRQGNAPYIVSIDNDAVFVSDDALENMASYFEAMPQLGVLGLRVKNFYTQEDDLMSWVYPKTLLPQSETRFLSACFPGGAHALRREALDKTGWYEDNLFFSGEERDLAYQIINAGYEIEYFPDVEVLHKLSPDARRTWNNDRFYYHARNTAYLHYKYFRSPYAFLMLGGLFLKGLYNWVPLQALRATFDALKLMLRTRDRSIVLTEKARDYVYEHELKHRGPLWSRLRKDIFQRLPQ